MIRIHKPVAVPSKLMAEGKNKAAEHYAEYIANEIDYQSGTKTFNFSNSIYNHPSVKDALVLAQHKKCCFCESLVGNDGDVEHFRPKSAYTQNKKLERPGYYWLAYDWDNLYLSCSACNQRQKKNLFPIADTKKRAHLHNYDITIEEPLFIDPGKDDPSKHIGFRGGMPYAIRGNKKGKTTIENLALDRNILKDVRLKHLNRMRIIHKLIQAAEQYQDDHELQKLSQQAKEELEYAVSDQGEFAAATRAAVKDNFNYFLEFSGEFL
jgi:uncharacterized protein (TIGR02646 family)